MEIINDSKSQSLPTASTLTSNQWQRINELLLTSPDDWSEDDRVIMDSYFEQRKKKEEDAEHQRQIKEEKARLQREEGQRNKMLYLERMRAYEQRENKDREEREQGSIEWFISQAQQRNTPAQQYRITNHLELVPNYLSEAYRLEVERRGGVMEKDVYTQRSIDAAAKWVCNHHKPGLMLRGYIGVGKTTMLYAIATLFDVLQQQKVRIYNARTLTTIAKDDRGLFDEIAKYPLLGIDDLGTEPQVVKSYGNETTPIMDLLTRRYDYRQFTLITTNLATKKSDTGEIQDELQIIYGDRLADRFAEMFNTIGYEAEQPSYRSI